MTDVTGATAAGQEPGRAQQAAGAAQDKAQQAAGTAQEKASQVAGQVQGQAQQVAGQAQGVLRSQVDQRSTQAGQQVNTTASDIRSVAEQLRSQGKDGPARIAEQAADRVQGIGSYLERSDADRILQDVEDIARRQPWAVMLGGLALGFAASRFLKASSTNRYETRSTSGDSGGRYGRSPGSTYGGTSQYPSGGTSGGTGTYGAPTALPPSTGTTPGVGSVPPIPDRPTGGGF
jgi:hypothetical protein